MQSLADRLLANGAARLAHVVHGETVSVLTGADAGLEFVGVLERNGDAALNSVLGDDPRAACVIRFLPKSFPALRPRDLVRTADGRRWVCVLRDWSGSLTVDYEFREVAEGVDT